MRIAGTYSFNGGKKIIEENYASQLADIKSAISAIDEEAHKTKESAEKGMVGKMLYSPSSLNKAFKEQFAAIGGWAPIRVKSEYSVKHYETGYTPPPMNKGAFREMDFVKRKLGVEVQFGKYAFMVYNVCAKMTIFKNLSHIDVGVEIVPMKAFVDEMSSGVSFFEQFVWDLEKRGVSNIDIPVLILGITADWEKSPVQTLPDQLEFTSDTVIPAHLPLTGLTGTKPGPKPKK